MICWTILPGSMSAGDLLMVSKSAYDWSRKYWNKNLYCLNSGLVLQLCGSYLETRWVAGSYPIYPGVYLYHFCSTEPRCWNAWKYRHFSFFICIIWHPDYFGENCLIKVLDLDTRKKIRVSLIFKKERGTHYGNVKENSTIRSTSNHSRKGFWQLRRKEKSREFVPGNNQIVDRKF